MVIVVDGIAYVFVYQLFSESLGFIHPSLIPINFPRNGVTIMRMPCEHVPREVQ